MKCSMPVHILETARSQVAADSIAAHLIAHYELPEDDARSHRLLTAKIAIRAFKLFVKGILVEATRHNGYSETLWGMPILRGGVSLVDNGNVDAFNKILAANHLPSLTMSAVSVMVDHIGDGRRYDHASIRWSTFDRQYLTEDNTRIALQPKLRDKGAIIVFDWGIATGLTVRTVFNWLKALGFHDSNLYCLALIGVPSEINSQFPTEQVVLGAEAGFRPGTIYVDHISGISLKRTKDWGHSHYPTNTKKGIDDLLGSLNHILKVSQSDVDTLTRLYSARPSSMI